MANVRAFQSLWSLLLIWSQVLLMVLFCFEQDFGLNFSELYITKPHFLAIWMTLRMWKIIETAESVIFCEMFHCVKFAPIRSFFWSLFSYIQSEYRKIRTRKTFIFGDYSRSVSHSLQMERLLKVEFSFKDF